MSEELICPDCKKPIESDFHIADGPHAMGFFVPNGACNLTQSQAKRLLEMAALLEITLNAGVEPSQAEFIFVREENDRLQAMCQQLSKNAGAKQQEIARLTAALMQYADRANWVFPNDLLLKVSAWIGEGEGPEVADKALGEVAP